MALTQSPPCCSVTRNVFVIFTSPSTGCCLRSKISFIIRDNIDAL